MDDPVETRVPQPAENALPRDKTELQEAVARFSKPEFRDEITRLYGEAIDRAIDERDRLAAASAKDHLREQGS